MESPDNRRDFNKLKLKAVTERFCKKNLRWSLIKTIGFLAEFNSKHQANKN